jgi:hypothetical protein
METIKLKNIATTFALIATIGFSSVLKADEIPLPVISRPFALQEGTQTALTPSQIAELLPWAKDSKVFLMDLLENTQGLSTFDQIERLTDGLKQVVIESAPKNAELLMRYSLNRALVLNEILNKEMDTDSVGSADAKLRVLRASIKLSIRYYEIDMNTLTKKTAAPFVTFGIDYFDFLSELNKSVFDASAQYSIQRTALEWFQWDLYRDVNNASFAPQIVKINNSLKTFPNKTLKDGQSISYLRQMKAVVSQIKSSGSLADTIKRLNSEKQNFMRAADEKEFLNQQAEDKRLAEEASAAEKRNKVPMKLSKGSLVIYNKAIRTVAYLTDRDEVVLAAVVYTFPQAVAKRSEVEKVMTSYKKFEQGNIILNGITVRTLEYIGENETIVLNSVAYTYPRDFVPASNVSQAVTSYGRFTVGDKVLYNNNIRIIEHLDANGRMVLKNVAYTFAQEFTTASKVSKAN